MNVRVLQIFVIKTVLIQLDHTNAVVKLDVGLIAMTKLV